MDLNPYLQPAEFIDSDHPDVAAFARDATKDEPSETGKAIALYEAVRDGIVYDVYVDYANPANYRASDVLASRRAFCIGKAALLAAACRAVGIPARVGYADVRNHMTSPRLQEKLQTDLFIWHSYAELHLGGAWVKATPAFDAALCARINLPPLAFDGRTDSLFQAFDPAGRKRLEYVQDRGPFADVPFDTIVGAFRAHYPALMTADFAEGEFRAEARGDAPAQE